MNYAVVYLGFILFVALVYWFARGRKFYTGPLIEAEVQDDESRSSDEDINPKTDKYSGEIA
jgi:hypothetical protein